MQDCARHVFGTAPVPAFKSTSHGPAFSSARRVFMGPFVQLFGRCGGSWHHVEADIWDIRQQALGEFSQLVQCWQLDWSREPSEESFTKFYFII